MTQEIWRIPRVHVQPLLLVTDTLRNNGAFNRYIVANNLERKLTHSDDIHGITRISTGFASRWYSLTKMLTTVLALRPDICTYMRKKPKPRDMKKFITEGEKQVSASILGVTPNHEFTDTEINEKFLIPDEMASQPDRTERVIGISNEQWDYATMAIRCPERSFGPLQSQWDDQLQYPEQT
jgi:hypothetical protein